jgi:Autophagy-related protein 27
MQRPQVTTRLDSGVSTFHILFYLMVTMSIYFGVGYYLNSKRDGSSGVDALPHKEFWTTLPATLSDILMTCVRTVFGFSQRLTQRNDYTVV